MAGPDKERTFVMLKPDAVQRAVSGEIIKRFEKAGLKIIAMKMFWVDAEFSRTHYKEHVEKPFYPELEALITEGPVVAMVLEGKGAISVCRKMVGSTRPEEALPGTIRGDFAHALGDGRNLIHASDSTETAKKETELWFKPEEIHTYKRADERHVIEH